MVGSNKCLIGFDNIRKSSILDFPHFERITSLLPFLNSEDAQLIRDFKDMAYFVNISSERKIFTNGDNVNGIALLMTGQVRGYKIVEPGREIILYRFGEGEPCVITANEIFHNLEFPAIAVVEQDVEAILIPDDIFNE